MAIWKRADKAIMKFDKSEKFSKYWGLESNFHILGIKGTKHKTGRIFSLTREWKVVDGSFEAHSLENY